MRADATAHAGCVPAIGIRAGPGCAAAAELMTPAASVAAAAVMTARHGLVTCDTVPLLWPRVLGVQDRRDRRWRRPFRFVAGAMTDRKCGDMIPCGPQQRAP